MHTARRIALNKKDKKMPSRIYDNLQFSHVSIGNSHSLGIIDGKIVGWGSAAKGKLDFSHIEGKNVIHADCGYSHSAAVTEDGIYVAAGNDRDGKIGISIENSVSVRCSRNYTAVLTFVDGVHSIHVFGSQTLYRALPHPTYSLNGKSHGVFNVGKINDYCISDEGELTVAIKSGEIFKIGSHKLLICNVKELCHSSECAFAVKVSNPPVGYAALFMLNCGDTYLCKMNDDGSVNSEEMSDCAVDIFSGNNYWGYVTEKHLNLYGEHFGSIKIPDDFRILAAYGGNNGYAISVCDQSGNCHTILCGDNTKNKELVIGDYPSRENPKIKNEEGDDSVIFDVRKNKASSVVVTGASTEKCEMSLECEECEYKFVSEVNTCPLCEKEITVNG